MAFETINKLVNGFFGWKYIPKIVVTIPLSFLFKNVCGKPKRKSIFLTKKKGSVGYIKIPQGEPAVAVYRILGRFNCKIIHLGFCCGLDEKFKVGDIVVVNKAYLNGKFYSTTTFARFSSRFFLKEGVKIAKSFTVSDLLSLINCSKGISRIKKNCVADMETGRLYGFVKNALSINVVSDTLSKPLFALEKHNKEEIKKSTKKMIKFFKNKLLPKLQH